MIVLAYGFGVLVVGDACLRLAKRFGWLPQREIDLWGVSLLLLVGLIFVSGAAAVLGHP